MARAVGVIRLYDASCPHETDRVAAGVASLADPQHDSALERDGAAIAQLATNDHPGHGHQIGVRHSPIEYDIAFDGRCDRSRRRIGAAVPD